MGSLEDHRQDKILEELLSREGPGRPPFGGDGLESALSADRVHHSKRHLLPIIFYAVIAPDIARGLRVENALAIGLEAVHSDLIEFSVGNKGEPNGPLCGDVMKGYHDVPEVHVKQVSVAFLQVLTDRGWRHLIGDLIICRERVPDVAELRMVFRCSRE